MITPFDDFVLQTSANQQRMAESIRDIGNRDNGLYRLRRKMLPQGTLGANAYTVSPHDSYIGWCGGTASKGGTIQFPGPGSTGMGWGRLVIIKDEAGSAASFPMLIEGTSSQSFDGIGSVKLDVNYGAVGVVSDGTAWQVAFRNPPNHFGSAVFGGEIRTTGGIYAGGTTTAVAAGDITATGAGTFDHVHITTDVSGNVITSGDTTGGVLRVIRVKIEDATDAAHIKCTTTSNWNGDANAVQDNIGADGIDTGVWNYAATGLSFDLLGTGISGNPVGIISTNMSVNATGTAMTVWVAVVGTAIRFMFYDLGGNLLTPGTFVDQGLVYVELAYLTTA